jgi:two-component system response regulator HydG
VHVESIQSPIAETVQRKLRQAAQPVPELISRSPFYEALRAKIGVLARSTAPVLLVGESGTGKDVVARLLHARSGRSDRPFVAVNCAALPRDVIDNELFGHEREAYTGANSRRPGCFEAAHGGTLFLDEIAEMHPQSQAKLLRAIETRTFRRLGGHEEMEVDVRFIAATNKELSAALASKEFREDLYYRLNVIEIDLPPLRSRREDVPLLVAHFLGVFCERYGSGGKRVAQDALDAMTGYDWPGNVRELRNVVERAVVVSADRLITLRDLPPSITRARGPISTVSIPLGTTLAAAERMLISETISFAGGNKSKAAQILGVSRKAVYDKLGRGEPPGCAPTDTAAEP